MFEEYSSAWKPKRIYAVCDLNLWVALSALRITLYRPLTKDEYKQIIKEYPGNTTQCRCHDMRYLKLIRKAT